MKNAAKVNKKENGVRMRKCSQPWKHRRQCGFSNTHAKSLVAGPQAATVGTLRSIMPLEMA
jgi:hypothetical protein